MKMRVKGQTAMEYLMTYGWAILIVIVVIAALYSMGVFTPSGGVPISPPFSTFAYVDHDPPSGVLIITSGSREIQNITMSGSVATTFTMRTDIAPWTDYVTKLGNSTHTIRAGTKIYANASSISDGEVITIDYLITASGMWKTDSATLHTV